MRKLLLGLAVLLVVVLAFPVSAAEVPVTRRDGFVLIWNSIRRALEPTTEKPFVDVPKGAQDEEILTYAKRRGLVDDNDTSFHPDEPLTAHDALLWLFRTRSIDADELYADFDSVLPGLAEKYGFGKYVREGSVISATVRQEELLTMMRYLDAYLVDEIHESSLYAEKFHGKGTAFGESFDMYAMTAAHRTFPKNTLVEVTNIDNGKKVTVRINDRGPFIKGRDMDLSLAAFTSIAERSRGKINVRFRRLGDASLMNTCGEAAYAIRLGRSTRLTPGIPSVIRLGETLTLSASAPFVVRSVRYPDGTVTAVQNWVVKDERYSLTPSVEGEYVFRLSSAKNETREFPLKVVTCGEGE